MCHVHCILCVPDFIYLEPYVSLCVWRFWLPFYKIHLERQVENNNYCLNVTEMIVSTHAPSSLTSTIWELDNPRWSYGIEVASLPFPSTPLILPQYTFPEVVYKLNVCK